MRGGQVAIVRVLGGVLGMDFRRCFEGAVSHEERGSGGSKISMEKSISGDDASAAVWLRERWWWWFWRPLCGRRRGGVLVFLK